MSPAPSPRARHRRLAVVLPAAALVPVLLAACKVDVDVSADHENTVTYDITEKVGKVSVVTTAGKVAITEKDISAVRVTETRHWDGGTEPTTSHDVDNGTVGFGYKCAKHDPCWVSYELEVPRGTAARVESDAGEVRLTGLSGELDIATSAGSIDGDRLTAAKAVARTTAGSVELSFASAPHEVDARTTAGSATVRVPGGRAYDIDVDATVGDTEVAVPADPNASDRITVRTTAGRARVLTT